MEASVEIIVPFNYSKVERMSVEAANVSWPWHFFNHC